MKIQYLRVQQGPKDDLNDLNGWNKVHPGVDDDEDVEDEDEDAILEGR